MTNARNSAPIFMFGFERSGTTLLSMITGAHPELAVPLAVAGLWFSYSSKLANYNNLESDADVEKLVADLLQEERIKLWDEELSRDDIFANLTSNSYGDVVGAFHRAYAQRKGKPCWGNLDIATLDHMEKANQWFPNARFIHIVRDGRDVSLSHETMPYGASNTLECAQKWRERLYANLKMGGMLGEERYFVLRYEDLVLDPENTLSKMCEFMGLSYSNDMLKYADMVDQKVPEDKKWLWPALDKPLQSSKCFGWKAKMDAKRRIVFEGEAGAMLDRLGYEVNASNVKSIMAHLYELWCFLGRGGRFRRLKRRLGLGHVSKLEKEWRAKK